MSTEEESFYFISSMR